MNKIQFLLLIFIFFSSCENTIEDRIPAFQAYVNGNQFWEASAFSITTDTNGTMITGNNFSGTILMHIPSLEVGINDLGVSEIANAIRNDLNLHDLFRQVDQHIMNFVKEAGIDNNDHWVEPHLPDLERDLKEEVGIDFD